MLNKSVLVGRLTKDPSFFKKSDMMISTFCLAVERGYKGKDGNMAVDFIVCKAFGKLAYNIHEYTRKGQLVALTGQIQTRAYMKEDKKQFITEIICETIKFLNMPTSSKGSFPQTKEDIHELISESVESYSNDLSSQIHKEKQRAMHHARENSQQSVSDEMYDKYSHAIKVINADSQVDNNDARKVTTSSPDPPK